MGPDHFLVGLMVYGFIFGLIVLGIFINGLCLQYVVNFWVSYYKGKPVNLPLFPAIIAGVLTGGSFLFFAVITWIFSFVLKE